MEPGTVMRLNSNTVFSRLLKMKPTQKKKENAFAKVLECAFSRKMSEKQALIYIV